jgi:hypothetical protein
MLPSHPIPTHTPQTFYTYPLTTLPSHPTHTEKMRQKDRVTTLDDGASPMLGMLLLMSWMMRLISGVISYLYMAAWCAGESDSCEWVSGEKRRGECITVMLLVVALRLGRLEKAWTQVAVDEARMMGEEVVEKFVDGPAEVRVVLEVVGAGVVWACIHVDEVTPHLFVCDLVAFQTLHRHHLDLPW